MTKIVRIVIRVYQYLLSPFLGDLCRFSPSCSDYALQAIERHGLLRGVMLATKRVCRCNPYCKGGPDPVPACLS